MSDTIYSDAASDINLLAQFLAHEQIENLESHPSVDCIVICGSAILYQAEKLFQVLQATPCLAKTIVLCGGRGHSTSLMWDAVDKSPKYQSLGAMIRGKPEARVLDEILKNYFNIPSIRTGECRLLIEDESTNCGANALKTRNLLERFNVSTPGTCIIIQDPTMALRTMASFEKIYETLETPPNFFSCPLFVPEIRLAGSALQYVVSNIASSELWEFGRFMDLILGEIPRLRNDKNGYGPVGKGFITKVIIPIEVEEAWKRLRNTFGNHR